MLLFGFLYLLHDILAGQTSKKSVRMQQEKKGADSRPRGTRKSRHKWFSVLLVAYYSNVAADRFLI